MYILHFLLFLVSDCLFEKNRELMIQKIIKLVNFLSDVELIIQKIIKLVGTLKKLLSIHFKIESILRKQFDYS